MNKRTVMLAACAIVLSFAGSALAEVQYINRYIRRDGTEVRGHYRDTSNDGYRYNNANELGYNRY